MNRAPLGGGGSEELCIGSGRNRYTKSPGPPQDSQRRSPMLSVYDGRECIGFILRRGGGGAEAFTADDRSVGLFKDDQDAALELWRRSRRQT
jgi:hypothetical protein